MWFQTFGVPKWAELGRDGGKRDSGRKAGGRTVNREGLGGLVHQEDPPYVFRPSKGSAGVGNERGWGAPVVVRGRLHVRLPLCAVRVFGKI